MPFGKGYRKDSRDYGYRPHQHLIAASPPLLSTPNLLPFTKGWIWQDGAGMCVGMAVKRAVQQWLEANGFPSQPMISGDFAYKAGRVAERIGEVDVDLAPPLEDNGSEPGLVLLAARSVGVRLESDFPDPSTPRTLLAPTLTPWSINAINAEPKDDELVAAFDLIGLEFFEITAVPGLRRQAIRDCMVRKQPVIFSMFVDSGFERNLGDVIRDIDETDPSGGGHMLTGADATDDDHLVFCNWWRNDAEDIPWGDVHGNGRLAWAVVETNVIQAFGVRAAPLTLRKA